MVRVNGQPLEPNDGEDVREHVITRDKYVVTFDELIELETAEEQETVRRVLRKLPNPPKGAATE